MTVILLPVAAIQAAMGWEKAMDTLTERTRVLKDVMRSQNSGGVATARKQVESALKDAIAAASTFAATGTKPSDAMQSRWSSELMNVQDALNASKAMVDPGSAVDGGWQIPGTSIIVPWAAIIGVLAVAAAGWYFSRRR